MPELYRRMRPLLGTFVEVGLYTDDQDRAEKRSNQAFAAIERVHRLLSFHDAQSDLSRLNLARGKRIKLDPLSLEVLKLALQMMRESQNLFNFTVGGTLVRSGILPNHGFGDFLDTGTALDLEIFTDSAQLHHSVLLTLDGIAKGFAVDLAVKELGDAHGWINAGGDLKVFGEAKLPVQIQNSYRELKPIGVFQNVSLATSQVRDFHDPDHPGAIVSGQTKDPKGGTWSVLAIEAWRADALTKVACQLESFGCQRMLRHLGGLAVFHEGVLQ